jgi:ABC-type lipoprotein export system ATPase subunit
VEKPGLESDSAVAAECRDLHRNFKDGSRVIRVLRGTNLSVRKGDFVAIVGTSGSGKTTLLNLIGGFDWPTSGIILVDGVNITSLDDEHMSENRRKKIGVPFQDQHLLPVFAAMENVEVPMLHERGPCRRTARAVHSSLEGGRSRPQG